MTRSRDRPTSDLPPVLTIPRSQFEAELDERIKLGEQALQLPIGDQQQLEAARSDFYMWDDYNKDLLRRRFTTSEIADEYAASAGVLFIGGQVSLQKDLKEFRDDFRSKLSRLKAVKERIPLFDEGSRAQEPGRGRVVGRGDRDDACLAIQLRAHRVSGARSRPALRRFEPTASPSSCSGDARTARSRGIQRPRPLTDHRRPR